MKGNYTKSLIKLSLAGKTTKISNEEVVAMAKSVTRMLPEDDDFYDLYLG